MRWENTSRGMTECGPNETFDFGLFTSVGDSLSLRKFNFCRSVLPNYQHVLVSAIQICISWIHLTVGHGKDGMRP